MEGNQQNNNDERESSNPNDCNDAKSWDELKNQSAELKNYSNEEFIDFSARTSRLYSIFLAIKKLDLLSEGGKCIIHIVGADQNEGSTVDETIMLFKPLYNLIRSIGYCSLALVMLGPNVPEDFRGKIYTNVQDLDFHILYTCEEYHEYWQSPESAQAVVFENPTVAFCFNAGVWGYDSWEPTLKFIVEQVGCPIVVTSYNELEAEDDEEVIESIFKEHMEEGRFQWFWRAQPNPFSSQLQRASKSFEGRVLADNCFWQCFGPLIIKDSK